VRLSVLFSYLPASVVVHIKHDDKVLGDAVKQTIVFGNRNAAHAFFGYFNCAQSGIFTEGL